MFILLCFDCLGPVCTAIDCSYDCSPQQKVQYVCFLKDCLFSVFCVEILFRKAESTIILILCLSNIFSSSCLQNFIESKYLRKFKMSSIFLNFFHTTLHLPITYRPYTVICSFPPKGFQVFLMILAFSLDLTIPALNYCIFLLKPFDQLRLANSERLRE